MHGNTILSFDIFVNELRIFLIRDSKVYQACVWMEGCDPSVLVPKSIGDFLETMEHPKLTHVAVCRGPMGFTQLRLILSLAQGIALGHDARIFSLTRFEIWKSFLDFNVIPTPTIALIPIRNDTFYTQIFYEDTTSDASVKTLEDIDFFFKEHPQARWVSAYPLSLPFPRLEFHENPIWFRKNDECERLTPFYIHEPQYVKKSHSKEN